MDVVGAARVMAAEARVMAAAVRGKKQISEIRPRGAPFGVKRVHGVAGEGTEMRLASRTTPRHRISDQKPSSCV